MPKRTKRAAKSISSLQKQIKKHENKMKTTKTEELRGYYQKEIQHLKDELEKKRRIKNK
ncbi:MAG: hypothetical protein JW778_01560 [Candidatus Altiarchaeota archaeon]|nr:hypothetical protein [Candidatus Altiarchaeota archaeon]